MRIPETLKILVFHLNVEATRYNNDHNSTTNFTSEFSFEIRAVKCFFSSGSIEPSYR